MPAITMGKKPPSGKPDQTASQSAPMCIPMRITSVEIDGFRCHKLLRLDLHEHHVLVGENGSGKTAVLDAIRLACSPTYGRSRISEQDFHNADESHIMVTVDFNRHFIVKVPDGFTNQNVPCKSVRFEVRRREQASPGKALSDPFVAASVAIPIPYDDAAIFDAASLPNGVSPANLPSKVVRTKEKEQEGISITRKSGNEKTVRMSQLSLSMNDLLGFPQVYAFDRHREKQARQGFSSLLSKVAKELNWRFRKSADLSAVGKAWEAFYAAITQPEGVSKRLAKELIGPVLKQVAEVVGTNAQGLELSLLNVEQPFAQSFLSRRDGLNQIEVQGLGSGISMLLVYYLLEHFAELAREATVFLIDEPEMHLHPQLQRHLADHLVKSSNQTIISTHSPSFVDLSKWQGLTRFKCDASIAPSPATLEIKLGGKPVRDHLDEIAKWKQHLTVFVDSDPEILFARRVLLVEGPAERYGLPRMARVMATSFPDTTVVSCNGKTKIIYYATVCRAYGIPTFAVYDLDSKPSDIGDNALVASAVEGYPTFTFTASFEALLGVSANDKHKASKVLERIDEFDDANAIPQEIKDAILKIAAWASVPPDPGKPDPQMTMFD